ncbi:MAG: 50S ribosomal protein L11 methyltransferase [Gammaproteobacteria bacterium]
MPWIELHAKTTSDYADSLSDQLSLLGAQAVTFQDAGDQPIYEPKPGAMDFWQETIVIGLFDYELALKPIIVYLEEQQAAGLIKSFWLKHIADEDWERVCLQHFKSIQFGSRLWVCPSWQTPPDPDAVNVILDPGLAFGTGTHPTTALCLEWLDQHITAQNLVIDYGCGSGILGLAALKLGAKRVLAIDNDRQALDATQQNAERNQFTNPEMTTYLPEELGDLAEPADVLIANILAQPLIELAKRFSTLTKTNSKILLSGILIQQVDQIKEAYLPWFELKESKSMHEWVRLSGYRR